MWLGVNQLTGAQVGSQEVVHGAERKTLDGAEEAGGIPCPSQHRPRAEERASEGLLGAGAGPGEHSGPRGEASIEKAAAEELGGVGNYGF